MRTRFLPPRALACVGLVVGLLAAGGCGLKEHKRVGVRGAVTYKGRPVTAGSVYFVAEDDPGVTGGAAIRGDGTFTAEGVPLGRVRVAVQTQSSRPAGGPPRPKGDYASRAAAEKGGPPLRYVAIPDRFERVETANLAYTVEPGKELTIALPD